VETVPESVVDPVLDINDETIELKPNEVHANEEPVATIIKTRLKDLIKSKIIKTKSIDSVMEKVMSQLDVMINKIVEEE
jgi:hypothetical protein